MADQTNRLPRKSEPKKSEMIEVRVSWETKRDFLAACQRTGRTASDVVRASIDDFIATGAAPPAGPSFLRALPRPMRRKRYLAAGAAVAGVALLAALPSAAAPGADARFRSLDTNGDCTLTIDEFSRDAAFKARDLNKDGKLTLDEYRPPA